MMINASTGIATIIPMNQTGNILLLLAESTGLGLSLLLFHLGLLIFAPLSIVAPKPLPLSCALNSSYKAAWESLNQPESLLAARSINLTCSCANPNYSRRFLLHPKHGTTQTTLAMGDKM